MIAVDCHQKRHSTNIGTLIDIIIRVALTWSITDLKPLTKLPTINSSECLHRWAPIYREGDVDESKSVAVPHKIGAKELFSTPAIQPRDTADH